MVPSSYSRSAACLLHCHTFVVTVSCYSALEIVGVIIIIIIITPPPTAATNEVKHFGTLAMYDLVFLQLLTVNFRVTLMKNLWPLPVFCALGIAALSTVQNVVTTCSQHFDRKSIAQRCQLVCNITRIRLAGLVLISV